MKFLIRSIGLTLFLVHALSASSAQNSPASPSALDTTFEDSAAGLQHQVQTFLGVIRSGDQAAVQSFLDSFAIPNSASWFIAHFGSNRTSELAANYIGAF